MRIMFRLLLCAVLVVVLLSGGAAAEVKPPEVEAEAVLLLEVSSGKVLYGLNADRWLFPASTTKILTALLALEHTGLDDVVTVGEEINRVGPNSSLARLRRGDMLTVAELLYAMLLPSGNDAAHVLAVHVARAVSGQDLDIDTALDWFGALMTERAAELGAQDSNFVTPDGYHHPDHYSSARDLAVIARAALEHEFFCQVMSTRQYVWEGENRTLTWFNTNLALHPEMEDFYDSRVTGMKTGYTPEAGACLVITAGDKDMELLSVVLNSSREQRFADSRVLLDYGFANFAYRQVLRPGQVLTLMLVTGQARGEEKVVQIRAAEGFGDWFRRDQQVELLFIWDSDLVTETDGEESLKAPLSAGQTVGRVQVLLAGEVLAEAELTVADDVAARDLVAEALLPIGLALAALLLLLALRRSRRREIPA